MKIPTTCPKCHEPLINDSIPVSKVFAWRKTCNKKIDHSFICISAGDGIKEKILAFSCSLGKDKSLKVFFDLCKNKIVIHSESNFIPFGINNQNIPWFEPNINEYDKLIKKIKTYIVIS